MQLQSFEIWFICADVPRMDRQNSGGYCSTNLTQWLVFSYGPAEWTGLRKAGNAVDVLHAFRISGNIEESCKAWRLVAPSRRAAAP